jgi:hypothetical protein
VLFHRKDTSIPEEKGTKGQARMGRLPYHVPPAEGTLGTALRQRRGLSRRAPAGLLGVVPDTVGQLEAGRGRLDILERALVLLGAVDVRLVPAGRLLALPPRAVRAASSDAPAERRR